MPTKKPEVEWISKREAARLLKVGTRQIERREAQGYVEKRQLPREPGESVGRVVYSRADIDALKAGKPNVHARVVQSAPLAPDFYDGQGKSAAQVGADLKARASTSTALAVLRPSKISEFEEFARLFATIQNARVPLVQKPWLTLSEAEEFSGLPASYLLAQARRGALLSVNVGQGSKEYWRFNRAALEK